LRRRSPENWDVKDLAVFGEAPAVAESRLKARGIERGQSWSPQNDGSPVGQTDS